MWSQLLWKIYIDANDQLEGFPSKDELKTINVRHNLQVIDFVANNADFAGIDRQEVVDTLAQVK